MHNQNDLQWFENPNGGKRYDLPRQENYIHFTQRVLNSLYCTVWKGEIPEVIVEGSPQYKKSFISIRTGLR